MIPDAAVEAALNARLTFKSQRGMDNAANLMRHILAAATPYMLTEAANLIRDLTGPNPCRFDHHGGCQDHGYLSLKPGETCPQQDAKEWHMSVALRGFNTEPKGWKP